MKIPDKLKRIFLALLCVILILILWKIIIVVLTALGWTPANGASDVSD